MLKLKKKLGVIMLFFGITAGFFSAGILSEWNAGSSVRAAEGDIFLRDKTSIDSIHLYLDYDQNKVNTPLAKEEEVLLSEDDNLTLGYSFHMSYGQIQNICTILEEKENTPFFLDTGSYLIPKNQNDFIPITLKGIEGDLGKLYLQNNKGYVTFEKNTLLDVLDQSDPGDESVVTAGFFFGCSLGNPPTDQNETNCYQLSAENITILDKFGFYELEKTPKDATLEKMGKLLNGDTIEWTIEYTPSQNKTEDKSEAKRS